MENSEKGVVRWKFAFQWCEEQGLPWWWEQGSVISAYRSPSLRPCLGAADLSSVDQPASLPFQHTFVDRLNELAQDEKASELTVSDAPLKPLALVSAETAKSLDMDLRWAKRAKKSSRANTRKVSGECCTVVFCDFL